jgi:cytochrome b subunit of formate dehydrogenase
MSLISSNHYFPSRLRLSYLEQLIIAGLRFQLAALLHGLLEFCRLLGGHVVDVSRGLIDWVQSVLIEEQVFMFRTWLSHVSNQHELPCT